MSQILTKQVLKVVLTVVTGLMMYSTSYAQTNANPAPAKECLTQQQIAAIAVDFKQFAPNAKAQLCDDNSPVFLTLSALNKLKTVQFETSMPVSKDELFRNRFGAIFNNWYTYFTKRIKQIELKNVSNCAKSENILAYVQGGPFSSPTMFICPALFDASILPYERVETMLHEARHKDGFSHITCTRGPRANIEGACDQNINDLGSYAVSVESLSQISKYAKGLNPSLRMFLAGTAIGVTDAFQEPVKVDINQFLLLKTAKNTVLKLDLATMAIQQLNIQLPEGKLINKDDFTAILPADKTQKSLIFSNIRLEQIESKSATLDTYNKLSASDKASWVDINYGKVLSIIKKTEVEFICDTSKLDGREIIKLSAGQEAATMIYPFDKSDITQKNDFLLLKSGQILQLSCNETTKKAGIAVSKLKFDNTYSRIYTVNKLVFGLGLDNRLYQIKGLTSALVPSTSNLQIVDLVPRKSYLFFE